MVSLFKHSWLVILFWSTKVAAQNLVLTDSIITKANLIQSDNLGRIFYTKAGNELLVYDLENKNPTYTFSDKRLGNITSLDVSNPLNTLIYSNLYQQITLLDRTLNPIAKYNLLDYDINQCTAVGLGVDNSLWIFDAADFKLKKFSYDNKTLVSNGFFQLFLEYGDLPNQVIFAENAFYLNIPNKYILKLDLFGTLDRKINIQSDYISILEGKIIFKNKDIWKMYDPLKLDSFPLFPSSSLPVFSRIAIGKKYLIGTNDVGIWIYRM
jgi:hypothetical protein